MTFWGYGMINRDDIISLWDQAVAQSAAAGELFGSTGRVTWSCLERFHALAVAAEREACAKLCEGDGLLWGQRYAAAIRAMGE